MDPKATSRNTHYFHSFFLRLFTTGCQSFIPRVQTQFHDHTINSGTVACVHVVQKTPHDSHDTHDSPLTIRPSSVSIVFKEKEESEKKETCEKI